MRGLLLSLEYWFQEALASVPRSALRSLWGRGPRWSQPNTTLQASTGAETLGVQQSTPIAAEMWPHLRTCEAHGGSAAVSTMHPTPPTPALCQAPDPYGTDSAQSSQRRGDTHARLFHKCTAPGSITNLQIVCPKG